MLCPRARHSGSVGRALDWLVLGSLLAESLSCVLEQDTVPQLVEHLRLASSRLSACRVTVLCPQGAHRLEKYLNSKGFLEKSLKIKYALKSTRKSLKCLEKSLNSSIFCRTQHF